MPVIYTMSKNKPIHYTTSFITEMVIRDASGNNIVIGSNQSVSELDVDKGELIQLGSEDNILRDVKYLRMGRKEITVRKVDLYYLYSKLQTIHNLKENAYIEFKPNSVSLKVDTNITGDYDLHVKRTINYNSILLKGIRQFVTDLINPVVKLQTFIQTNKERLREFNDFIETLKQECRVKLRNQYTINYSAFSNFTTFINNYKPREILKFIENNGFNEHIETIRSINNTIDSMKNVQMNFNFKGLKLSKYGIYQNVIMANVEIDEPNMLNELTVAHLVTQNEFDNFQIRVDRYKLINK
jgi:hypothetical protein